MNYTQKPLCIVIGLLVIHNLSACAHPTATKVEIQKVFVEVQKPCPVTKPVIPAKLKRPLPADPARLVDLLTAKLLELMGPGGYTERADAAIATCVKP